MNCGLSLAFRRRPGSQPWNFETEQLSRAIKSSRHLNEASREHPIGKRILGGGEEELGQAGCGRAVALSLREELRAALL